MSADLYDAPTNGGAVTTADAARPVRVLLVDRDSLARRAMRDELTGTGEFVVVAEAAEAPEALSAVSSVHPDLVLVDIGYPQMGGISVAKELHSQTPGTPIVFCSIASDDDTAIRALSVGAAGYVGNRCHATCPGSPRHRRW